MRKRLRLNVQVVCEALLVLAVTLGILAYFSHKALHEEAVLDAEQTLEGTVQSIDNVLLGVEQSTGNIYYDLLEHLDDPDRMYTYSRELVASDPDIAGCAIAFKPGYYPGKNLFMAYVRRKTSPNGNQSELETLETFAERPYTEQAWYSEPMTTGYVGWIDPLKGINTESEPLVTFCLPFGDKTGQRVGVIAVDVSINRLSKIVLAAKPSEHAYCVLLARNGSYIVHPDKEKLSNPDMYSQKEHGVDVTELEAAKAMLSGESGIREFRRGNDNWYVFFKPFERVNWEGRSSAELGWSVGVVYPEDDIFSIHDILLYLVLGIAVIGILLFFLLCSWMLRSKLQPLRQLSKSAQTIANGKYNEMMPYTERNDEIGLLQNRFEQMQLSLQSKVDELKNETTRLHQHGDMLRVAYDKTLETDDMKSSFLNYMTNQMASSAESIDNSVTTLCNSYHDISQQEVGRQVDNIQRKGQTIVELLNYISHYAETNTGKEADHD